MRFFLLLLVLKFCFSALAESESQTDWAGGPGVLGPVTDWQNTFYISADIDWDTTPGQIKLEMNTAENQISSAFAPRSVISCDVDLDSDLDILCCADSGEIFWSENKDGDGTEWERHTIAVLLNPESISSADFDNNGFNDIAVSCFDSNEVILLFCSAEGWSNGTAVSNEFFATQITAIDIDRDGLVDIAGVSEFSNCVSWLRNNGTASQWTKVFIDNTFNGVDACDTGDFNNDGYPDVVASSSTENTINVYISQVPFGLSWEKHPVEVLYDDPVSIAVADYNNDGSDDFAIASSSGDGNLYWYDYLDTQSSWISHKMNGAVGQNTHDIDAQDMDGDGFPDVIVASVDDNRIIWCKNREYMGENWQTAPVSAYFAGAVGVSTGDMDGDTVKDVLGCSSTGNMVSWWRVSGFSTPGSLTSSILNIEPPNPDYATWDYIYWSQILHAGTGIRFRLKTSYLSGFMGSWSVWIETPCDIGSLVAQGGQYLQYQTELYTTNPNVTPSLKDITVLCCWPGSTADEGNAPLDGRKIWLTSGNPVSESFGIGYSVEKSGFVSVAVYDVTGRAVEVINDGNLAAGQYTEMVTDLPAGSYAVVMQSEQGTAAQRVVVAR